MRKAGFFRLTLALVCALWAQAGPFRAGAAEYALAPDQAAVGRLDRYRPQRGEVLLDVARAKNLGYVQFMAANAGVDPWMPEPGDDVALAAQYILPAVPRAGIVVNLAWQRLFYFPPEGGRVITFPIGVRRAGMDTPLGEGRVVRKKENPTWYPTTATRQDRPELPGAIGPGPNNPLGEFALYLSWPTILIHGTNKPYGVGRTVSRGCVRLYPEDIAQLFAEVAVGTPVRIIDEEVAVGWVGDDLYVQVYPNQVQADEIETAGLIATREQPPALVSLVAEAADAREAVVDWAEVARAGFERSGIVVKVASMPATWADDAVAQGGTQTISLR